MQQREPAANDAIHTLRLCAALPLGCFVSPQIALCSQVMTSLCMLSKAVTSHRPTATLQQSCIQDTDVSSCCIQSLIFQDCSHFCPHSQKLHSLVRPIYLSQPVALTHLCHTLLSHSVAREMRRCGGRWEFNKLW